MREWMRARRVLGSSVVIRLTLATALALCGLAAVPAFPSASGPDRAPRLRAQLSLVLPAASSAPAARGENAPSRFSAALPSPDPSPKPLAVRLNPAAPRGFAPPPVKALPSFAPRFKEQKFRLDRAVNLRMVERFTGPLNKERRRFLQENRFLLIPQEDCRGVRQYPMTELFTEIAKGRFYKNSLIPNALFVGPDPFLHALHGYVATRLQYLEQTRLSLNTLKMLEGLYDNAARLRNHAGQRSAASFARLQAQFLTPLVILKSAIPESGEDAYAQYEQMVRSEGLASGRPMSAEVAALSDVGQMMQMQRAQELHLAVPGSLERALELLALYAPELPAGAASAVRRELEAVYAALPETMPSPLLSQQYGPPANLDGGQGNPRFLLDYGRFLPRGHYAVLPIMQCYFRAMAWLGELSWDLSTTEGAMDAVNFALAMSLHPTDDGTGRDAGGTAGELPRQAPCDYWRDSMELTAFFAGRPEEAGYAEWAAYLRDKAGSDLLDGDAAADPAFLTGLHDGLASLKPEGKAFAALRRPKVQENLRVFPRRMVLPLLLTNELRQGADPERRHLPALFSSLWMPALLGSPYAFSLLDAQTDASLRPRLTPTPLSGAAVMAQFLVNQSPPSGEAPPTAATAPAALDPASPPGGDKADDNAEGKATDKATDKDEDETDRAMRLAIHRLAPLLAAEGPESWTGAIGLGLFGLLETLTPEWGKGMPLYMRAPAFQARQLESFLGSYAELRSDTLLYDENSFVTAAEASRHVNLFHPIPNGFVEPNLPFWHGMLALVDAMTAMFDQFGLFAADRRPGGALASFRDQLALCAALAEKELRGQALSRKEYDALRESLDLMPMIRPVPDMSTFRGNQDHNVVTDLHSAGDHVLYGATAAPYVLLVLVGNEQAPRLTVGVAYNHQEFVSDNGKRLTGAIWQDWLDAARNRAAGAPPLPEKPFWYAPLAP